MLTGAGVGPSRRLSMEGGGMANLGEMVEEKTEIAPGLVIDRRLKLPGIRMLEERYGLKFHQFDNITDKMESLDDMLHAVFVLAQQHDKNVTMKDIESALAIYDLPVLMEKLKGAMVDMLTVQLKNVAAPAESATATL
jgi:hypothetical protein